jgi:hypothetical protein
LTPKSLKSLCLVDKSWRGIAAGLLWHTLVTNLRETSSRGFDALLTSSPGGFVDCVRVLEILDTYESRHQLNTKLLQLLALLPRGSLSKFIVEDKIESQTLGILIKKQSRLRELSVAIYNDHGSIVPPNSSYIARNLDCLKKLTIFANATQASYDSWFPHMPSLETLTVQGKLSDGNSLFKPWYSEQKLKIRSLHMDNMWFLHKSANINAWTDLSCLEKLTIRGCKNMGCFSQDVIAAYSDADSALKSLTICEEFDTPWITNLEKYLETISGLEYLYVSASTGRCIQALSLCKNRATLRYLVMEPLNKWTARLWNDGGMEHVYKPEELIRIAKECPHIEEFGTSLVQLDFQGWPSTEPFVWQPKATRSPREQSLVSSLVCASFCMMETKLIHVKDALATFPKLRVLRLTQPPIDMVADDLENPDCERQWRYQQFAEQILQYFAKKESPVKLLAFSPTVVDPDNLGFEDNIGHTWPHYYYVRGESTTVLPRNQHIIRTVAVPVKKSDIAQYIEEPRILSDPVSCL